MGTAVGAIDSLIVLLRVLLDLIYDAGRLAVHAITAPKDLYKELREQSQKR